MVDTSDEWIVSRTGISERRVATKGQVTSDFAVEASYRALEMAGRDVEDVDLILCATVTPDFRLPSLACIIQKRMGLNNAAAMDIAAACAGFIHGLSIAQAYIAAGTYRTILVIGAEMLSSVTNYEDRNTCILFGDAAGAAIVEPSDNGRGVLATYLKSDGRYDELLNIPLGGAKLPFGRNGNDDISGTFIRMNGNEVFKHAVRQMGDAAQQVIKMSGLSTDDIDWLVPHQANIRILQATAKRLNLPMEKVYLNLEKFGNTSSASVPVALDEAVRAGKIKEGDHILSVAFGGGLTWGAVLIRW
jgi:3-oxoacyl-[acyl-carrier-protein] synthase-3